MSSSRSERGYGQGEEDKRRKSQPSNQDFVQKYSQEDYSRAILTNVLPQAKPRLGEYCVPVDSTKPLHKKSSAVTLDDYNCDVEHGYAQPHDSLLTGNMSNSGKLRKDEDADSDDDEGDVYELAKQTPEDYHVPPPQKKPSPKPRKSFNKIDKSPQHEHSKNIAMKDNDCSIPAEANTNVTSPQNFDPAQDQFPLERKRTPKKVVEIEYEVASDIRKSQPPTHTPPPPLPYASQRSSLPSFNTNTNKECSVPSAKGAPNQTQSPNYTPSSPKTKTVQSPSEFVMESLYEEPWDLKAKRLKQEQEEKKCARKKSEPSIFVDKKKPEVYEEAWDSPSRQRRLEEKLQFAQSFSTEGGGGEVCHDAVDDHVTRVKPDPVPPVTAPSTNLQPQPQPMDTYEDAWDLKNKILEERLSKMHMQSAQQQTVTYEEPWDNSKQQKELQDKLHRTRQVAGDKPIRVGPNLSAAGHILRSTSDARDHGSQDAQEAKANYITRGRHHSIDSSNLKGKSRSGNNPVGQRINPSIPLINQNWFHGNITRDDAEQMLCVCREGSFIVRISSDRKSYSLSIKSAKQNIHVQIEQSAQLDGSLRYILGKNSKEFSTIPEMIDYYTQHRVPLKGAEHITLLHPVECKWSQQSSS